MTREADQQSISDWHECPRGEVGRLVARLKSRRRREVVTQAVVAGTALSVIVIVGGFVIPSMLTTPEPSFGGVTCSALRAHAEDYLAGTLDEETRQSIDRHLSICYSCREYLRSLHPGAAHAGLAAGSGYVVGRVNIPPAEGPQTAGLAGPQVVPRYEHCGD
jgi:hypothetical protein